MQHSPYEIKERLLGALDKDYNVVDMPSVIQVISLLEKTQITKDALEKTRLGKYVNELRKRTTNEPLARRAKELVKNWRRLLEPPSENIMVNGERISPPGPGPGIVTTPSLGPGALTRLKSSLEGYHSVPISRYKAPVQSVDVPSVRTASPLCCSASSSPIAPTNYAPVKCEEKPNVSPSQRHGNGKQHSPSGSPTNSAMPVSPPVRRSAKKSVFHSSVDIAKTNVANKRLRKDDAPDGLLAAKRITTPPVNSVHAMNGVDNGDRAIKAEVKPEESHSEKRALEKHQGGSLLPSARLQKVKTTQQLIDELQNKKGSAVPPGVMSITLPPPISECRTESLASLKNKTGRKSAALNAEMSKTKSELMDRFLNSSASQIPPDMMEPSTFVLDSVVPAKPINEELERIFCMLPPLDPDTIVWDQEAFAPTNVEVNPETLERYCDQQWEHVNGTYDHERNWRRWEEVCSSETAGEEVLQILPYVNTDW